jgi:hypothetical protein
MLSVKKELVQAILNYLSTRPYREVAQLIEELVKAVPETPKEEIK